MIVALLALSLTALVDVQVSSGKVPEARLAATAVTAQTVTTPPPTTVPPTTVPPAPKPAPATRRGPVAPPKNSYALEPIVEIGTIEIPKLGLNHRIFHGITLRNIDIGPSHWPGTAYPGEIGNTVFAGHRVTRTRPFRNIDQLVPGDEIIFTVHGARSVYRVTGHEIVPPSALYIADPTPTATATLFACHPPGSARFRYVIRAALAQ